MTLLGSDGVVAFNVITGVIMMITNVDTMMEIPVIESAILLPS